MQQKNEIIPPGNSNPGEKEKILLMLFPFWPTLIPPMGISCLKNYLEKYGYQVKSVDTNVVPEFKQIYDRYFSYLKNHVPENNRGNFYSIARDVLRSHMLAHINYEDESRYLSLVKILIYKTFYVDFNDRKVNHLNQLVGDFFGLLEEYFLLLLEKEKPTLLGCSVYKGTVASSLFGFRLAKQKYPHLKTVMGGGVFADQLALGSPNLEFFLEKTKNYIDKIIIGEGEQLFLKLLKGELPQSQQVYTLKDIHFNPIEISTAAVSNFSGFNLEYYPYLPAFASRGCPFRCSFCSETVRWGKYRKKNPGQTVKEMIQLSKTYGSQLFLMTDSLLNPIIDDLAYELTASPVSLYWDGYLRADKETCNTDKTLLWRRGGFYRARLGIESGSPRVLALMNKKITPDQIKLALTSLAYAGIKTSSLWIIGYPGETEEDFLMTLSLIKECKDYLYDAEGTPFWYFLTGQVKSNQWEEKSKLLYPQYARDMLILQEWVMDGEPTREETYKRMNRFVSHCSQLGIPNPYSLDDIYHADLRWQKLHQNAVPPLMDFNKNDYINENKKVTEIFYIPNQIKEEGDFNF